MPTATLPQIDEARSDPFRFRNADAMGDEIGEEADAMLPSPPLRRREVTLEQNVAEGSTEHVQRIQQVEGSTEHVPAMQQDVAPLIRLSPGQAPQRRFKVLQQWEGVVSEVADDTMWADLYDLTDQSNPLEVVEIPLEEIDPADQPLLRPGSVFYWCIGYDDTSGGRRRVSEIRVRRTPEWSQHAIDSMKTKALDLLKRFNGKDESTTSQ